MAGKSNIEWTEHTWNPIVGCSILTPGCTNCYAMKMAARIEAMKSSHYDGTTKKIKGNAVWTGKLALAPDSILLEPLRRKKPTTYFVNSMGDLFHEDAPDEWIDKVLAVMALCPHHTFQVLTKRAKRMLDYVTDPEDGRGHFCTMHRVWDAAVALDCKAHLSDEQSKWLDPDKIDPPWPLPNVWLGVSTERQQEADERIPLLLHTPAAVRFISAEPLLGPIDLTEIDGGADRSVPRQHWTTVDTDDSPPAIRIDAIAGYRHQRFGHYSQQCPALDWVIVGGESGGSNARFMELEWARSLRDQCATAGAAFFFKQWGEWVPGDGDCAQGQQYYKVGKKRAGRLLDGIEHNAMPEQHP